ncbi:helix-hairpin-helix domain-containing protein [Planococcus sp. N028]|uniref:Helix-hairpin-helix domain-containing protein n=1 Tax=Planococcus shixiaomingii TaxID=3058393 RepID=A0ABT8MXQ0_9BACL|nr:helix-hairpin-helix domain-containing protein [Planococcus sp. N028]MDN7240417.1 helix-hairpin-helix domain-containing protein [Planococcus sp. N028]
MNFSQLQNKIGWLLIPTAAILMLAIYFFFPQDTPETVPATSFDMINAESPQQTEPQNPIDEIPAFLMVDVKGQVASPGVFELPIGARMQDAIEAAGGFLPTADDRAINLAMKVQDEMSVYVPEIGEEIVLPSNAAGPSGDTAVNLNAATEEELMTLPGIGPSKATAIIAYRTDNGNFQNIDELKEVSGIGDKTFEKLKELIKVN